MHSAATLPLILFVYLVSDLGLLDGCYEWRTKTLSHLNPGTKAFYIARGQEDGYLLIHRRYRHHTQSSACEVGRSCLMRDNPALLGWLRGSRRYRLWYTDTLLRAKVKSSFKQIRRSEEVAKHIQRVMPPLVGACMLQTLTMSDCMCRHFVKDPGRLTQQCIKRSLTYWMILQRCLCGLCPSSVLPVHRAWIIMVRHQPNGCWSPTIRERLRLK
jgi:hypothetical protein